MMDSNGWISVGERLPDDSLPCLVYFRTSNDHAVAIYRKGNFYMWEDVAEEYIIRVRPDHWQPLPPPPEAT